MKMTRQNRFPYPTASTELIRWLACAVFISTPPAARAEAANPGNPQLLFEQCAAAMVSSLAAELRCRMYLAHAPDYDQARQAAVRAFVGALEAKSSGTRSDGKADDPVPFTVLSETEAGMVSHWPIRDGNHRVRVIRAWANPEQGPLLRRAEATWPQSRSCPDMPKAQAAEVFWSCSLQDREPLPIAPIPAAFAHYLKVTSDLAAKPSSDWEPYRYGSSLTYLADITQHREYRRGKHVFKNVQVADIIMEWNVNHGWGGSSFATVKTVVLGENGSVLALFVGHPSMQFSGEIWAE
jgi:hypothetical protein